MIFRPASRLCRSRGRERGIALILAIIVIFILTVLGLALLFTTTTEFQIASAETTVNRTFYAADSGVQFALAQGRINNSKNTSAVPCAAGAGWWCFNVLDQGTTLDSSSQPRVIGVSVTPFRIIDYHLDPGNNLNVGSTQMFDVEYHFDSIANDANLNAQKQVSVDFTVGPKPMSIEDLN